MSFTCLFMSCANHTSNANFNLIKDTNLLICLHIMFQISFQNSKGQKSYRKFLGVRSELLLSIVYPWSGIRRRPSVVSPSVIFFSETAWPIKAKIYVEPPWVGGTNFCWRHLGHMTKMTDTPIYGKKTFKNNLLQNRRADFHETWYIASGTPAHHTLFKI